ncbi:MAG: histidine--tRNA ligase [Bdellovibrionales bacterium]|jgi:histidyl-tRNA synthetase|nr:histidine--tRNA ligase [Bdellovibrionales bacterium]
MSEQNKVYKPKSISGFPEWLPEYRAVELQWLDKIRAVFESYGFCNIETPSVEEIDALSAKAGETEKEIYTLTRLQADDADSKESRLALHFDLTVPMARYVAQHFGQLVFPFKRYQMQKSWRGERPQKGRYREFYQCDIDVVNIDDLPIHFDAELPAVLFEAYQALNIPPVELHISNRKMLIGYLQGLGIADTAPVTRVLDKLDKIGVDGVFKVLIEEGLDANLAQKALAFVQIKTSDSSFADRVRALGVTHELMEQGIAELQFVTDNLKHLHGHGMVANLGIIRGLDYYTGSVFEVRFKDSAEHWPKGTPTLSIGGGGRYDDLAGSFINQKLPGIGVSMGLTRLFGLLLDQGKIAAGPKSPADVLVVLPDEARRAEASETARTLRARGFKVEMYHRDAKIKNQIAYAEKKGITHVWFPPFKDGQPHEVKNMTTGEQKEAQAATWQPG